MLCCLDRKSWIFTNSSFFTASGTEALPFGVMSFTRSSSVTLFRPFLSTTCEMTEADVKNKRPHTVLTCFASSLSSSRQPDSMSLFLRCSFNRSFSPVSTNLCSMVVLSTGSITV